MINCIKILNVVVLFVLSLSIISCSHKPIELDNGCESEEGRVYDLYKIEVNGVPVFQIPVDSLIKKLDLKIKKEETTVYEYTKGRSSFLIDKTGEIVGLDINDSSLILTHPFISLQTKESEIEKMFPLEYKMKSIEPSHPTFGFQRMEVTLNDCKGNRLRIYLYNGKVHSVSYWTYEDLDDMGNELVN